MTRIVDARGLACPQPVILTRQAMSEPQADRITIIVDSETALHNVSRMASKAGYEVTEEERGDLFHLHLARPTHAVGDPSPAPRAGKVLSPSGPLVLVVPGDRMGRGPEELGAILMRSFLHTLGEVNPRPDAIIFLNEGVKLTAEGSQVLEDLSGLAERGVEILVCGTCLDFFELKEKIAVGEVSNMYTITETLLRAGKVVTL